MKYNNNWFKKRLDSLERYTTKQEKEFLLLEDDVSFTDMLKTLSPIEPINEYEAIAFLFKLREISLSNIIEITHG